MQRGGLPGHMAKARRIAREKVALVDVVLEVVDARAPSATHSVEADTLGQRRPRVVVMSHSDLAWHESTGRWLDAWSAQGISTFAVDAVRGEGMRPLKDHLKLLGDQLNRRLVQRGRRQRPLRAIVVGLPNVGKSSLLNRLTRQAKARTGAKPGITRGEQWIRSENVELLDLPGMLPVRAADVRVARVLATLGVLPLQRSDALELAVWLLAEGLGPQVDRLLDSLGIPGQTGEELQVLQAFARSRGRLTAGGELELEEAALIFMREWREGRWGRFTLEEPGAEVGS